MAAVVRKIRLKELLGVACCWALKALLVVLYAPLKLIPAKAGKVLFLSRQFDGPSLDACLLFDELRRRDPSIEVVCICRRVNAGFFESLGFFFCLVKSLYHLSTAQVCVLDSYWPAVSVLKHKQTLKVVQMWHSLGKIKKSGLQTLDKPGGRSGAIARIMRMHAGYDFVIAGAEAWNSFYCESFGISARMIRNVGLPRIDYLLSHRESLRKDILAQYPSLAKKTVVLYAPTFRRGASEGCAESLLSSLDFSRFAIVVKSHPNQRLATDGYAVEKCAFSALSLLPVAEYLITDYSAIALEAAVLNVKTLYYVPDYEEYKRSNGLNIDLFDVMPGCVFSEPYQIREALEKPYPQESLRSYREKYLPQILGNSAQAIADIVIKEAGLCCGAAVFGEVRACSTC